MSFKDMRPGKKAPAPSATAGAADTAARLRAEAEAVAAAEARAAEVVRDPTPVAAPAAKPLAITPMSGKTNGLTSMLTSLGFAPAPAAGVRALSTVSAGSSFTTMYPCITLTGGSGGGSFAPHKTMPAEYLAKLPQGVTPVQAVFLSYRYLVFSWPVDYDSREDGGKPVFSAIIPNTDSKGIEAMTAACKNYNFTPKANRGKFDYDKSGVGHIMPTLEVLVYVPSLGELMMISVSNYGNVDATSTALMRHVDPDTQVINPFPCTIRPITTDANSARGKPWKVHSLDFNGEPNALGAKLAAEFSAWLAASKEDPEISADFQKWVKGEDGTPLDADIAVLLAKAKHI